MTPRYLTLGLPMPNAVVPLDDDDGIVRAPIPDPPRRAIVARPAVGFDDYWVIEWAEWEGEPRDVAGGNRNIYELDPARLEPCTCVEGPGSAMADLAEAVLAGATAKWKRCAVAPVGEHFAFWSPRNSSVTGVAAVVHGVDARAWARAFLDEA